MRTNISRRSQLMKEAAAILNCESAKTVFCEIEPLLLGLRARLGDSVTLNPYLKDRWAISWFDDCSIFKSVEIDIADLRLSSAAFNTKYMNGRDF